MRNDLYEPLSKSCSFCGSGDFIHHSKATYWTIVELNFTECRNCGLIFANPMPSVNTIIRGNDALNVVMKSRGTVSQYKGGKEFSFYLKKIKPSGILLDVGCAEGFFLKGVEDHSDWKAEGVDLLKSAVDFANEKLNLNTYFGTLESLKDCKEKYDFVRMNNIIEHVQNPVVFLNKTNEIMKSGGLVLCSTPNGVQDGSLLKTANKQGTVLNLLENHFHYYKPKTLKTIFEYCGFKIEKAYCDGFKHSLKEFGLLPWKKIKGGFQNYNMNDYEKSFNDEYGNMEALIPELNSHPSIKTYKIKFNAFINRLSKLRINSKIPVGHQQTIIASKFRNL